MTMTTTSKKRSIQQSIFASFQRVCNKKAKSSSNDSDDAAFKIRTIFCDLDGVLVDFEGGVRKLFRIKDPTDPLPDTSLMWRIIRSTPQFFRNLEWTSDGERLWETLWKQQRYRVHILTGAPRYAVHDKHAWCETHLNVELQLMDMVGPKKRHERQNFPMKQKNATANKKNNHVTKVIACHSVNKHCECRNNGDVLIDDRESLRTAWEQAGGIFVHHTSTETTLQRLTELGILVQKQDDSH